MTSALPELSFADFNSVLITIIGVCANGAVALIALILLLVLAWNYLKLLCSAAERYVLLGVMVFTAPMAFAMGACQATSNIFKSWCRMFAGQLFSAGHERLVPAAVREHGRCVHRQPAVALMGGI